MYANICSVVLQNGAISYNEAESIYQLCHGEGMREFRGYKTWCNLHFY